MKMRIALILISLLTLKRSSASECYDINPSRSALGCDTITPSGECCVCDGAACEGCLPADCPTTLPPTRKPTTTRQPTRDPTDPDCHLLPPNYETCSVPTGGDKCCKCVPGWEVQCLRCEVETCDPTPSPTSNPVTPQPTPKPTPKPTRTPTDPDCHLLPPHYETCSDPIGSDKCCKCVPGWEVQCLRCEVESCDPTPSPTANPSTPQPTRKPTPRPTPKPTPRPTDRPTRRPTNRPTNRPTDRPTRRPSRSTSKPTTRKSREPTMTPTEECVGGIAWGDPHYHLMAIGSKATKGKTKERAHTDLYFKYSFQATDALGWYYYLFPCDVERDYDDWPFFLLAKHRYWDESNSAFTYNWDYYYNQYYLPNTANTAEGTFIGNNMLILNTKPDPWLIEFQQSEEPTGGRHWLKIKPGSGNVDGMRAVNIVKKGWRNTIEYTKQNPLSFRYDDGRGKSGTILIYVVDDFMIIDMIGISFRGSKCQEIEVVSSGFWTRVSCPTCLRNAMCGLMGKYVRGDCSLDEVQDPNSECHDILVGSDGRIYDPSIGGRSGNHPEGGGGFEQFARTWRKNKVDRIIEQKRLKVTFQKDHRSHDEDAMLQGRTDGADINWERKGDYSVGYCKDDLERVHEVNETCRLETVVKHAVCCEEIGEVFCEELWHSCVYDFCICAHELEHERCLDIIVAGEINKTCEYEHFGPFMATVADAWHEDIAREVGNALGINISPYLLLLIIVVGVLVVVGCVIYVCHKTKQRKYINSLQMVDDTEKFDNEDENEDKQMINLTQTQTQV